MLHYTKKSGEILTYEKCPVTITLNIIGGKWKPVILWNLSEGPMRFSELKRSIPAINQMTLTKQLRELERDCMILRNVYAEVPARVEYSLTDTGISVMPVLVSLCLWGIEYSRIQNGETIEDSMDIGFNVDMALLKKNIENHCKNGLKEFN
ncbi:MAG: helix-turn-helix transcriptional regulator [Methanomicrobiaceae archaeon]|nr:helix-turn-helix transcriptional regulator [Methanomicrobiaceae archaeon]